ncbi:MAG: hypothetical protein BGP25_05635 [Lysobacterales bacterium 63-13]|nr:MAG: hypothetical protein BGP25_05635 [Xanthomonadales bacterium 63-13]
MSVPTPPLGRFLPRSVDDFSLRAKHAAWLLETPLQITQEWLARVFGFSGSHELKQVLKNRAAEPAKYPAGPTDEDCDRQRFDAIVSTSKDGDSSVGFMSMHRSNALLAAAVSLKGVNSASELSARYAKIIDIGLFSEVAIHRSLFRLAKARCDVLDGNGRVSSDALPSDYAFLDTDSTGAAILSFTAAGRAVFDALEDVDQSDLTENPEHAGILRLLERYPANPWVKAHYVATHMQPYWQGQWAYNVTSDRDGYCPDDADSGYKDYAGLFALKLLPHAKSAISIFNDLYGERSRDLADHRLEGAGDTHGADTFAYPALLYNGGMIALNAGNVSLAKRWLRHNWEVVENDNFGSRYPLSALCIATGKGSASRYFKHKCNPDHQDSWLDLVLIAEHLRDRKLSEARNALIRFLSASPHALRAIDSSFHETDDCRPMHNLQHIVHFQEFFYRTSAFWNRHPEHLTQLREWTSHPDLRSSYRSMHVAKCAGFGLLLKPAEVRPRIEQAISRSRSQFEATAIATIRV